MFSSSSGTSKKIFPQTLDEIRVLSVQINWYTFTEKTPFLSTIAIRKPKWIMTCPVDRVVSQSSVVFIKGLGIEFTTLIRYCKTPITWSLE